MYYNLSYAIKDRLEALEKACFFYKELLDFVGFEMVTPSNVVDISDSKSVLNYWASNLHKVDETVWDVQRFGYDSLETYEQFMNEVEVNWDSATPEQARMILDKLTKAEALMSRSRAIIEMVQL